MSNSHYDNPSPLGPPAIYPRAFKRPRVESPTFQERVEQLERDHQKQKEHERRRKERKRELKRQFGQDASFAARVQASRIAKDKERRERAEQKHCEASKRAPKQVVRISPKSNEQHQPEIIQATSKSKEQHEPKPNEQHHPETVQITSKSKKQHEPKSNERHRPETVEAAPKPTDQKRGVKSFFANLKHKITKKFRKQEKST